MNSLPNQDAFLQKYSLQEQFERANISWSDLEEIFGDHADPNRQKLLHDQAEAIVNELMRSNLVYSTRSRVKDAEHLVAKVIRKRADAETDDIRSENYKDKIHDLVGVRALHLFKMDWQPIDSFIRDTWDLVEKPTAHVRPEDGSLLRNELENAGFAVQDNKQGYRSLHYVIKVPRKAGDICAEIQVRTIFEEGWAEIDHLFRYPDHPHPHELAPLLDLFSRFAGAANDIASYIAFLNEALTKKSARIQELETQVAALKEEIAGLAIPQQKKDDLARDVDAVVRTAILSGEATRAAEFHSGPARPEGALEWLTRGTQVHWYSHPHRPDIIDVTPEESRGDNGPTDEGAEQKGNQ